MRPKFISMKRIYLLLLLIKPIISFAQINHTVRGRVLDAVTREPLMAATVAIQGLSGGAYTDSLGQFQFTLKSGTHRVPVTIR